MSQDAIERWRGVFDEYPDHETIKQFESRVKDAGDALARELERQRALNQDALQANARLRELDSQSLKDWGAIRAELEKVRAERDAIRRDFDAELEGRAYLRATLGALSTETFPAFVSRIVAERDALKYDLVRQESLAHGYTDEIAELQSERNALQDEIPPIGSIVFPPECADFKVASELEKCRAQIASVEALCVRFETEAIGDSDFVEMLRAALTESPPDEKGQPAEPPEPESIR